MGVQIFQMSTFEKSCENICEFLFFRLKTHFLLLGGVSAKSAFSKKKFFLREDFFETTLYLRKHPQQVFWFFPHFFLVFFFKKNNPHILEELRQLSAKFHHFSMKIRRETRVQSWTFLALFFRKRIVHWYIFWWKHILVHILIHFDTLLAWLGTFSEMY